MSFNWKEALSNRVVYPVVIAIILTSLGVGYGHLSRVWASPTAIEDTNRRVDNLEGWAQEQKILNQQLTEMNKDSKHRLDLAEQRQGHYEQMSKENIKALREMVNEVKRR